MNIDNDIIRSNPYFKSLDDEAYSKLIQHMDVVNISQNEIVCHEGDFADAFYIVKEGAIRITTVNAAGKSIVLARIAKGFFFGEQAFSTSSSPRRQAAATAQMNSVLYKFPRDTLLYLHHVSQNLQATVQKQNLAYIKEKLLKLADGVHQSSYNIGEMISKELSYPKRSVIFYQGEPAKNAYILVGGEVELHSFNQEKQLKQIVMVSPGQIFGTEGLTQQQHKDIATYGFTAVAKHDAAVIVIEVSQYSQAACTHPLLSQLYANFNRQFTFKSQGKILQFRSEYLDMPATTSLISLSNGHEVVCQQVIGSDIFLATLANCSPTREILYKRDEYFSRELRLKDNKIVGLLDCGLWEDSHSLLDCILERTEITEKQLDEFSETGHLIFKPKETVREEFICKCMRVSRDVINELIISKKANLSEIGLQTGAGTICGGCKPTILEMLGTNTWTPCSISKIITHHPEVKSFQLKPATQNIPPFKPGQYLVVKAEINNCWVQRNYTLTSTPNMPCFEITVKKEKRGVFSPWLFAQADNNPVIYVSGPYGQFTYDEDIKAPIVCFMGGIGITPAVAFLRHAAKSKIRYPIYIYYSAYDVEQFILRDEFNDIITEHDHIVVNYRVTSIQGRLTEPEVQKIISSIAGCHIYICGPKGLEKLVTDAFNKMNLPSENLHVEQFIHAGSPDNFSQTISEDSI